MNGRQRQPTATFFLITIATLITIGLVFIYSSSSVYALEKLGSADYFVKKQFLGILVGLVGFFIARSLPIKFIKGLAPLLFIAALSMTALTLVPGFGQTIHGSHRWLKLGGFTFQPSEFLKMAFVLYIAYLLDKNRHRLSSFWHGFFPLLTVVGITALVLLKQPDFGQMITLTVTAFMLFFVAQCSLKHIFATVSLLIPVGIALISLKAYRLKRILTFLNPWNDPQGAGFQIIQSLIAIGSGGITGVGIAQSKQKFFYLPMQHTDFIFSIIAEETGFIGVACIIFIYLLFLFTGLQIAKKLQDPCAFYTTVGFVLLTSLQAVINIFVVTGLMPTKGLGLPFISYGNSALIANLCMVGVVMNFIRTERKNNLHRF